MRQATNGGRKNRSKPGNLREQIDPLMCQAYDEAKARANGQMWRTPDANCFRGASSDERMQWKIDNGMPISINDQVRHAGKMWPTPKAAIREDCPSERLRNTPDLTSAVKMWPTCQSRDWKGPQGRSYSGVSEDLPGSVKIDGTGSLNPDWVEILMGFPIGWTDIECGEPEEWQGWPAMIGQEQYYYEPSRVTTISKNRKDRLKAIGNAVCPKQAVPVFMMIREWENADI